MVFVVLLVVIVGFYLVMRGIENLGDQTTGQFNDSIQILRDHVLGTVDFRKHQLKMLDEEVGNIERRLDRLSVRIRERTGEDWDSSSSYVHEVDRTPNPSDMDTSSLVIRIEKVAARLGCFSGEVKDDVATLPARAGGEAAVGLSFIPQEHGRALS